MHLQIVGSHEIDYPEVFLPVYKAILGLSVNEGDNIKDSSGIPAQRSQYFLKRLQVE